MLFRSVLRAAMGTCIEDNYIENPEHALNCINAVVKAAIKNNVYVIIDWHTYYPQKEEAKAFFSMMAQKYGKYPHVIYEIYNEPMVDTWESVKEYSSKMQVYVTVPKTSDKVLIRDNAGDLAYDYQKLIKTDLIVNEIAKKTKIEKDDVKDAISAEVVDGTRLLEIKVKSDDKDDVKKISKEVLPVFQKVVQKDLGRNKLVIADQPSKIKAEQTVSTKKFLAVGAVGGFVVVAGVFFVLYLVDLTKKAKRN